MTVPAGRPAGARRGGIRRAPAAAAAAAGGIKHAIGRRHAGAAPRPAGIFRGDMRPVDSCEQRGDAARRAASRGPIAPKTRNVRGLAGGAPYAYPPPPFSAAARRAAAAAALLRIAWMARFSGSARYLRMASRDRARLPSARQPSEQYARGLPGPLSGANSRVHTRHTALVLSRSAPGGCFAAPGRRRRPFFRHGSEQYRTTRLGVENSLPHPLQLTSSTLVASPAALSLHGGQ